MPLPRRWWIRSGLAAWLLSACVGAAAFAGGIDTVDRGTATGWACTRDGVEPVIDLFVDGEHLGPDGKPRPTWARYRGASQRPDHLLGQARIEKLADGVIPACTGTGWRWNFETTRAQRSAAGPGEHRLHAIGRAAQGERVALQGSPQTLLVEGRALPVLPWIDQFQVSCVRRKAKRWPAPAPGQTAGQARYEIEPPLGDCQPSGPTWVLESTFEDWRFAPLFDGPGRRNDADVDVDADPMPAAPWSVRWSPAGAGHRLSIRVDRRVAPTAGGPLDTYLATAVQTELGTRAAELAPGALFIEIALRLRDLEARPLDDGDERAQRLTRPLNGLRQDGLLQARWRAMLGLLVAGDAAGGDGPVRFVEINLLASRDTPASSAAASFDLCQSRTPVEAQNPPVACEQADAEGGDETGLFDRRRVDTPIFYVPASQLHRLAGPPQAPAAGADGWWRVRVPVSALVRNLPWSDRPGLRARLPLGRDGLASLEGLRLRALYLGTETWGPVRLNVDFEGLRLYRFEAD